MGHRSTHDVSARAVGICFLLSGLASLLYQTVWLRLAMAHFGVNSHVVAAVLSVFMLGLALGSLAGGRWANRLRAAGAGTSLRCYSGIELAIACGGLLVPLALAWGREMLLALPASESAAYFLASFAVIFLSLLPFCTAMGATFPIALAFLTRLDVPDRDRLFSRLYLMNVCGALAGVLVPLGAIELWGFGATLWIGVLANVGAAALAWSVAPRHGEPAAAAVPETAPPTGEARSIGATLWLLGFGSLGLEVIWTRVYVPFAGNTVYAFATILAVYLVATLCGTTVYRRFFKYAERDRLLVWCCIGPAAAALLPSLDPALPLAPLARIALGVGPLSLVLGLLTPSLIDRASRSHPVRAGQAYAANLAGCILGPLVTGFALLPALGPRSSCFVLAAILFLAALVAERREHRMPRKRWMAACAWPASLALGLALTFLDAPLEAQHPGARILHDHTATVVAADILYVNGVPVATPTHVTKVMTHLPLVHLAEPPSRALVICLGVGTSFRSAVSWGTEAAVVELVPSVARVLPLYWPEAAAILDGAHPHLSVVVDDGRRYLDRGDEPFDVITIDPPPPVEAAATSLLYSVEFYDSIARRLHDRGIVQVWLPAEGDRQTWASVTAALLESFPHVRMFESIEGWGFHYLASRSPIPVRAAAELAARMPELAARDLGEGREEGAEWILARLLEREIDPRRFLDAMGDVELVALTDDRPINEYFLLRQSLLGGAGATEGWRDSTDLPAPLVPGE